MDQHYPRLLDQGVLPGIGSSPGQNERYRRGETPHTLHVWWARRPHRSMRALVLASLCCERTSAALRALEQICNPVFPDEASLNEARKLTRLPDGTPPKILDMFGGGGTIAFEASLLGAEAHSIDSNELAVFLQKTLLRRGEISHSELCQLVEQSGNRVLDNLTKSTASLFPLRHRWFGYMWTYSMSCRACRYRFYLSKRPWLSRKKRKRITLTIQNGEFAQLVSVQQSSSEHDFVSVWAGRTGTVKCPQCALLHSKISLAETKDDLVALVGPAASGGKEFSDVVPGAMPDNTVIHEIEQSVLQRLEAQLPDSRLPRWSGVVNPALYGIETHADFVNPRQRAVLLLLVSELLAEYQRLCNHTSREVAKSVVGLLSGLIDQLVDWNCRLSMWISQNEQVGRAFSGPGVAMLWDYVETDPVLRGPANLWNKLDRIIAGMRSLSYLSSSVHVRQGYAQNLPYTDGYFDAIVTDPPYYDNIYYNVLADFFYSWKRILFRKMESNLFVQSETDSSRELVASKFRHGDSETAHREYCEQLSLAIQEAERVLKPEGLLCLIYSHGSLRGWQALIQAYRSTGLFVTSVQPLNIERKARPRAMNSNAVNTCVVFVARRGSTPKFPVTCDELCSNFHKLVKEVTLCLESKNWSPSDIAIAAYAQGVGLLMNVSDITGGEDDFSPLGMFEQIVREVIPDFRVSNRKSL
ncbi:MAG: DUF1156 domain-containing protein [Gemmataceae bacterium]